MAAHAPSKGLILGLWSVLYIADAPSTWLLAAAVAVALVLIAAMALAERLVATKTRRSASPAQPLAPRLVMAATRGVYAGPLTVTVLIPAHNEAVSLPSTLSSLLTRFTRDRALMALGGLFYGEPWHGLIGQFQRNEYIRYARDIHRWRGSVFVLTGTASMFRPAANTVLAVAKILPRVHLPDWRRGQRSETRSIYPEGHTEGRKTLEDLDHAGVAESVWLDPGKVKEFGDALVM